MIVSYFPIGSGCVCLHCMCVHWACVLTIQNNVNTYTIQMYITLLF